MMEALNHTVLLCAFVTLLWPGAVAQRLQSQSIIVTPVDPPQRRAMTWVVREQRGDYVNVGQHATTDPYRGDTSVSARLPVLCMKRIRLGAPAGLITDAFYAGWSASRVKLSPPIHGASLTSRQAADELCEEFFGDQWRMAEFHDGGGGWSFWAKGDLSRYGQVKFWVAIDDQNANPWPQ